MALLAGFNTDNGSTLVGGNPLQPRAWKFAVTATGIADRLVFKAAGTGTYKFSVYALATIGGVPTTQLATTVDVTTTIGNVYFVNLSSAVSLTSGGFIAVAVKVSSGVFNFFKGNAGSANIALSGTDAAFSDPMDSPWSNTGGSTSSVPYLYLESSTVSIATLDKLESGSTSTITLNDAGFAATNVKITSDTITKTISTAGAAPTFTFTTPSWVDGATALKYGACSVVANDGTSDTTSFTSTPLTLASPLAVVTLTSVSANSLDKIGSFSPAWAINTQVVYDSSKITVYANGECDTLIFDGVYWVDSGFEGVTQVWGRDPTDKIARMSNVTISAGAPVVTGGGLTTRGLTVSGLTVRGLTVTGI